MALPIFDLDSTRSAAEGVHSVLQAAIYDGTLSGGERLAEVEVADAANVSRTPVREALRKLETQGLIVTRGRSKYVASTSRHELAELMAVREGLEAMAASIAARRASETDVEILKTLHRDYVDAAQSADLASIRRANEQFHESIWRIAGNRYLAEQLEHLRGMIQRIQSKPMLSFPDRVEATVSEHEAILMGIVERSPDAAGRAATVHFVQSGAKRLSLLAQS